MKHQHPLDLETLRQLEDRLRRGIPKWEQPYFIDMVVPMLVARLKELSRGQGRFATAGRSAYLSAVPKSKSNR